MEDDIEWVERPLTLADAVQCTRCREIKLAPHFYRHKTRKQLVSMGRVGAHTEDFVHIGGVCHDCLPPRTKRLSSLTRAVLDEMVVYGDISRVDYTAEVVRRESSRSESGAISRNKGWRIRREGAWKALAMGVSEELRGITYLIRNVRKSKVQDKNPELAFFGKYREVLTRVSAALYTAKRLSKKMPPSTEWVAYVTPEDRQTLVSLWQRCTIPRVIPVVVKKHFGADEVPHYPLYRADIVYEKIEE